MYVTAEIIREVEQRYGTPVEIAREYEMTAEQLGIVRLGTKHGRCHDVTLVIVDDERNLVVTRKPSYPPGAFRAPSGGIEPGESFDDGAIREAKEETGLDIVLEKYLIRAKVRFRRLGFRPAPFHPDERGRGRVPTYESSDVIDWTTHVLQARPTGGTLQPLDTREIVEARKATIAEITGPIREALLASGKPGLRYRAELDGLAIELLK
jgi:8-oxo-dGTP pyrophosphatase MutT (NUDIX family)